MQEHELMDILAGEIVDEDATLTLAELCRACDAGEDWIMGLVAEGILEPRNRAGTEWRFPGVSLRRARIVMRLQRDLGVNLSGAALAVDLIEEIRCLRGRGEI